MPHRRRVTALVAALLLLAACSAEVSGIASPGDPPSSSTTPPSGPSSTPTTPPAPTDEAPPEDGSFPADTEDDSGPAQAGTDQEAGEMHVSGLRLGDHNGYTRLVIDLSGGAVPEWTVGYSEATGPGGGPVDIAGDAFLRVQLRTQTEPSGQSTSRIRTSPGPIAEVLTTGYFEGYEEVLIGIRAGELPFRAYALTDPGRIVIDVRNSS